MEVDWIKPKTNWASTDKMNLEDYNRIKNNILYLKEKANEVNKEFSIQNMGEDIVDYLELWDYEKFNLFEGNIEKINQSIFTQDIGIKKTFYPNGMFIKYDELNRLEKACEKMKLPPEKVMVIGNNRFNDIFGGKFHLFLEDLRR